MPDTLEPDYSEAVLAHNAGEYAKAGAILDKLLVKAPDLTEFLELRALTARAMKDDVSAQKIYLALIQSKRKAKRPEGEIAPYYFEMALTLQRNGKTELSNRYFRESLANGFNVGVCHMYLGMSAFGAGNWGVAENHFENVLVSDMPTLRPPAHLYLGQTQIKMKYASGATRSFIDARASAREVLDSSSSDAEARKMARQIQDSTDTALAPYSRGSLFAHIGIVTGYDDNVLAIPSTSSSSAEASGKATVKNTLVGGIGYASSSLASFQYVPSFKSSINYNMNRDSRSAEFVNNVASIYLNAIPLARLSYGLKLEGTLSFQNDVDTTTDKGTFRAYSKTATIGPYVRYQPSRRLSMGLETSLDPRSYDQDLASGDLRRSGMGKSARFWAKGEQGNKYFNPGGAFKVLEDDTNGSEYRMNGYVFEASNAFQFSEKFDLSSLATYSGSFYKERPSGKRMDRALALQLVGSFKYRPKWTFLANAEYNKNTSNVEALYEYSRFAFGGGVTYSF